MTSKKTFCSPVLPVLIGTVIKSEENQKHKNAEILNIDYPHIKFHNYIIIYNKSFVKRKAKALAFITIGEGEENKILIKKSKRTQSLALCAIMKERDKSENGFPETNGDIP